MSHSLHRSLGRLSGGPGECLAHQAFRLLSGSRRLNLRAVRGEWPFWSGFYRDFWLARVYERHRHEQRKRLFMSIAVFATHNQPIEGYYMEFGCHTGRTMRLAYDAFHPLFNWPFLAFDSFEGLPEIDPIDDMPVWRKGMLQTSEEDFTALMARHGIPPERLRTIKGFYQDSLTDRLKASLLPDKAAVIFVDCDLYQSTVPVLEFAKDFLQRGTVLVFDDWFCHFGDPERGERRAFKEFLARHPELRFEDFIQTSEARAFIFLGAEDSDRLPDGRGS